MKQYTAEQLTNYAHRCIRANEILPLPEPEQPDHCTCKTAAQANLCNRVCDGEPEPTTPTLQDLTIADLWALMAFANEKNKNAGDASEKIDHMKIGLEARIELSRRYSNLFKTT